MCGLGAFGRFKGIMLVDDGGGGTMGTGNI